MEKCENNCNGASGNPATSVLQSIFPVLNGAINEQLHMATITSRKIYTNCVQRCADYGTTQKRASFRDECLNACNIAIHGVWQATTEGAIAENPQMYLRM